MARFDKMSKARARLFTRHVFFASLVLGTPMRKMTQAEKDMMTARGLVPTAFTDGKSIVWCEEFIEGLDVEQVIFVIVHEAAHNMFMHSLRMNGRNPMRWNIAADFAINLILKKAGFAIWEQALCDAKYAGMSAEQIYAQREQEREQRIKAGKKSPRSFGKGAKGEGTPDNGADIDTSDLAGDLQRTPGGEADHAQIEQQTQQRVAQAASMARQAGQLGGDLERLLGKILNPPQPWWDLLRHFAQRVVRTREDWAHRNRRIRHIRLPSMTGEGLGEIVVIGDSSGSITNDELAQVGCEVSTMVDTLNPERVRLIWADDVECAHEQVFEQGDEIILKPKGFGGTDMRKPLQFVEQYNPLVTILITDGYTPWPDAEPPYPLIVCCTTDQPVPVGDVVRMRT